jgi:hypothetical protein
MSELQRHFSLTVQVPISGIALVTRAGPQVEAWNRRHDRLAGLCLVQSNYGGVPIDRRDCDYHGTDWTLDFLMTGPLANDTSVAEFSALMLASINAPAMANLPAASHPT